jgi:hypothetical protein
MSTESNLFECLTRLNPRGYPTQWAPYRGCSKLLEAKLSAPPEAYHSGSSLIGVLTFEREAKDIHVYVTLSFNGVQLFNPLTNEVDVDNLRFLKEKPSDVPVIECNGSKCRRVLSFDEHHVWCTSCHGEPADLCNINCFLEPFINFNDIPREAILLIEGTLLPPSPPAAEEKKIPWVIKEFNPTMIKSTADFRDMLTALSRADFLLLYQQTQWEFEKRFASGGNDIHPVAYKYQ